MPSKRKDSRSSKGIALDNDTWELLDKLSEALDTNRSNLIEKLILERYGNEYDKDGNSLKSDKKNSRSRGKKTAQK